MKRLYGYYSRDSAKYGSALAVLSNQKCAVVTEVVFSNEEPLTINPDMIFLGEVIKIVDTYFGYNYDC